MDWGAFSHARATPSFCLRAAGAAGVLEALAAEPRPNAPPSMSPALPTGGPVPQPLAGVAQDAYLSRLTIQAEALSGGNAPEA